MNGRSLDRTRARTALVPAWAALAACLAALLLGLLVPSAEAASSSDGALTRGRSPMPGDAAVPLDFMPPGSAASPIPSDEIFPPQQITIRFNHKKHIKRARSSCKVCHAAAYASLDGADRSSRSRTRRVTTATTSITRTSRT
jgi:hypothetical protein